MAMTTEPTNASPPSPRIPPHVFWPGLVIAFMAMSVIAMTTTMMLAVSDPSFAVIDDYETKASTWNDTAAQRHASAALGWTASIEFGKDVDVYGERSVIIRLNDRDGDPVTGAAVHATLFHPARSANRLTATFEESDPGAYVGRFTPRREGLWEVELTARRGDDAFIDHQQQWLMDLSRR
jgi:nitrogen fixation protein FixH